MSCIGNVIWFLLGGVFTGLTWWLFGALAVVSIVGIPWGRACFVMGNFAFFPFGREAVSREELYGRPDIGTGLPGMIGNIIWLLLAGIWIAVAHVGSAVACAVTIIGIPFAWQHLKLAGIALFPIGMTVVDAETAAAARRANADNALRGIRRS